MAVEFFNARNSSLSAKANGALLHSAYNPQAEAERFVQGLEAPFNPACVIVVEPALSYCADILRKKFADAKIGALRFCQDFSQSDGQWDFCIDCFAQGAPNGARPLSERLFDALGEEGLFCSLFYEWPPSARVWPQETTEAWNQIKAAVQKARAVLGTREHFGKRWLKNKLQFFLRVKASAALQKIQKPVVVCASGPSLEAALPAIAKIREQVFVCALSSAASVLAQAQIEPDLCLSCDGGYWAKKHLEILDARLKGVPLALATEAACPAQLFLGRDVVPLCYDDDELSKRLFAALKIDAVPARRNGTVSGTALELFLGLADKIFFAGLDLQSAKGPSHARPNALEIASAQSDFRLRPKESRAALQSFKNPALQIYADWFCAKSLGQKEVYRITGSAPFAKTLGAIKDIDAKDFERLVQQNAGAQSEELKNSPFAAAQNASASGQRAQTVKRVFLEWLESDNALLELFPSDAIMARRQKDLEQKQKLLCEARQKCLRLQKEIFKESL